MIYRNKAYWSFFVFFPKIIEVQNFGYNFYRAAITAPFWTSMLSPSKITPIAGFSAMIVGGSVSLFFYLIKLTMILNAILGIVASFITLLIVSKFTKGNVNKSHQRL